VRVFDFVLALVVLAALVLIARNEFPAYATRTLTRPTAAASPATVQPTPTAAISR
jgi:hypothetical protein